jgi:hypothetical protein
MNMDINPRYKTNLIQNGVFKQNTQQPADASHGLYTHIVKRANSRVRRHQNMIHKLLHDNNDEFNRVQHKLRLLYEINTGIYHNQFTISAYNTPTVNDTHRYNGWINRFLLPQGRQWPRQTYDPSPFTSAKFAACSLELYFQSVSSIFSHLNQPTVFFLDRGI